jgi:hypothetical protein
MARDQKQLRSELENEVAKLRDLALKSTDPLVVAKAIAASDPAVQDLIVAHLSKERLAEAVTFAMNTNREARVFFRFVPVDGSIQMVDAGLLVYVDVARGVIIGTVDPFVLHSEQRLSRPFVAVSALNPAKFAASDQATQSLQDKQKAFFAQLGISSFPDDGFGGISTVQDTRVSTSTWSGNPRRSDDTEIEYTDDYVDCGSGTILA